LYSHTRVYLVETGKRADGAGIRPASSVSMVKGHVRHPLRPAARAPRQHASG